MKRQKGSNTVPVLKRIIYVTSKLWTFATKTLIGHFTSRCGGNVAARPCITELVTAMVLNRTTYDCSILRSIFTITRPLTPLWLHGYAEESNLRRLLFFIHPSSAPACRLRR
ncbi:Uncharacterized protein HZ326_29709 [Fusarium oxysporum f. sp. albedinis]|nr:Uncharacterized protein HZ326_29709 [Fusarium oxysporum f. sp. albedinis]